MRYGCGLLAFRFQLPLRNVRHRDHSIGRVGGFGSRAGLRGLQAAGGKPAGMCHVREDDGFLRGRKVRGDPRYVKKPAPEGAGRIRSRVCLGPIYDAFRCPRRTPGDCFVCFRGSETICWGAVPPGGLLSSSSPRLILQSGGASIPILTRFPFSRCTVITMSGPIWIFSPRLRERTNIRTPLRRVRLSDSMRTFVIRSIVRKDRMIIHAPKV